MRYHVAVANEEDIEQIVHTTKYFYNRFTCPYGFLLGYRTPEQLLNNLNYYYVAKDASEYAGHVTISFGTPPEFNQLSFYDTKVKDEIKNAKVIYIEHIVTEIHHVSKGVGSQLFTYLFQQFPEYRFMSSVVVKPYNNEFSLKFHHRNGFQDVAYYNNDVIENKRYESIYLLR